MVTGFEDVFKLTCGLEGADTLSTDPKDSGNWTGSKVGIGHLIGTKFGISAATFPTVDIPNLTYSQAQALAKQHYWDPYLCDQFSPLIGWLIFDAAYNGGHPLDWIRLSLGVTESGQMGAKTVQAIRSCPQGKLAMRFMAYRFKYWTQCSGWKTYGKGWTNRGSFILQTISDNLEN